MFVNFCIQSSNASVLLDIAWERIILDEAHEIRNKNAQKSSCCCRLEAVHRWCLTGTPIHNKLWDLYSLIRFISHLFEYYLYLFLRFLRVTPFSEEKMWKEFIDNSSSLLFISVICILFIKEKSTERLNTIVKSILLRRSKNQICNVTNKPMVIFPFYKWIADIIIL